MRNSGPFSWEPGAFAGFILIALVTNTIVTRKIVANRINHIPLLGLPHHPLNRGRWPHSRQAATTLIWGTGWSRLIIVPLLVVGGLTALIKALPFFGKTKIGQAMDVANIGYNTCFLKVPSDRTDFRGYPLLGMGMTKETRFEGETKHRIIHRNNGVTNLLGHLREYLFSSPTLH